MSGKREWRRGIILWGMVGSALLILGCNGGTPKETPKTTKKSNTPAAVPASESAKPAGEATAAPSKEEVATKVPENGTSAGAVPSNPQTPDGAVLAVLTGIRESHPEAIWDFLPASMQAHLNEAVREFGRSIDAELWTRSMDLLKKIVQIFETKKEFIFENPHWKTAERINVKEIQNHWDDLVGLCRSVVNSELADVEQLKKFDGRKFLSTTGAEVMASLQSLSKSVKNSPFGMLGDVKVSLKSQEGETAVVTIEVPGQEPTDYEFALLEGKWCPRAWVESAPRLESLKPMIAGVLQSDLIARRKEVFMQDLDLVEQGVNDLLATQTAKDFNDYVDQAVLPFLEQRMAALQPASPPASEKPAEGSTETTPKGVTVVVQGVLDDKQAKSLGVDLSDLSDNPDLSVVFGPSPKGESTEFSVTPVADVEQFAKRVTFGKVLGVDASARTVTVAPLSEKPAPEKPAGE